MAYIKVNVALTEICTLAVHTADLSLSFDGTRMNWPDNIPKLGVAASAQMRTAIQALVDADGGLAAKVIDGAEVIALLENDAWIHLVDKMRSLPAMMEKAVSSLMVVRNLETIADHAKSIAACVPFWVDGTEIFEGYPLNGSHVVMPGLPQENWSRKRSRLSE